MVIPLQSYIKRIDADGTQPFEEVRVEVRADAIKYFNLVLDPNSAKGSADAAAHGLIETLDIYESFHLIRKQTSWAAKDDRVELAEEGGGEEDKEDKQPPPPQIPASCTCKWCFK